MGNSHLQQFPNESLKLRNPPSPKLVVSGNMSQQKTTTGSPKSPKSPDDSSKSDNASSSISKSGRSPSSTKSSPGSIKSPSLAERLAQSNKVKLNQSSKSPVSKSSPTSPTALASPKTEVTKESYDNKSDGSEKSKVYNGSVDIKMENTKLSNENHSAIVENGTSDSNEEIKQDVSVESNEIEIKDTELNEVKENETEKCNSNETEKCNSNGHALDLGLENKPVRIDDSIILEQTSKKDIRQKVWEFMEENLLVIFPKPCFNRIPNFKGCNNVSLLLEKLDEFKKAKTVQVTPDKAQETARFLTLNWGKRLLVPLLRLKEGLLQNVSLPFAEPSAKMLRSASTQKGLRKWGNKLITLDQNNDIHIDMIILGSVAVDKKGRRIGIGNGFCDLEFVILSSMNMVTDNTVVVTIVHDVQVFDTLPNDIFKPYDVPVDIIITSNEIIRVENRLDRPKDVFWNYISKRRLLEMPPLQLLRTKQEKDADIDCTLKEVDSEPEEIPPSPRTYKKSKGYRQKRYSTRSETNDSVFNEVSKHRSSSKSSTAPVSKNTNTKIKHKRAKSTSSQKQRSSSIDKRSNQNDKKEPRLSSKKPNKRRTKSESAKTVTSPVTLTESKSFNNIQADSPSNDTPKNKRRLRPKQSRKRIHSDDIDKQSINQSNSNSKYNSRSNSRATRRDYIDRQDVGREMSVGRRSQRDYLHSPKKYYPQNYRQNSYSQERSFYHGSIRSNSRTQYRDSSRSAVMQQNRYSNGPTIRPTRYFNGSMVRHNSFNGPDSRHNNGINHHGIRHNSYSNDPLSRQNSFYDGVISRRNSFSKGSAIRQDNNYTSSRIFRPPQYRNRMASQTDEESRPHFNNNNNNNNRIGYFNSNEKPNYSRSSSGDEFVLKVGNIANNVRVRDLKAALMERGVKPLHITWRGPRGFAYLRYSNSSDLDKDNVMGSLQNVRIKPNGVETAQTQTLIVTECQFS
ncbi:uncharacterized protein LOC112602557 isoform X2 [Melanaphis sacchari]|uniref:uncharacterized protein LOC112602557 isoform X2 n=1 Tax=Melanaphis sacchari TaxID=742174 RepID=UPI000DC140A4|nr:uncharacterized protein LOC112602557 isoform X2 [Melanaphis sacchari]